jgi:hypothetical protein
MISCNKKSPYKRVDERAIIALAVPLPEEKPYFTAQNKDGFFGKIGSIFKGNEHKEFMKEHNP